MKYFSEEEIKEKADKVIMAYFQGRNNWTTAIYTLLHELGISVPYTVEGYRIEDEN